MVPHLVFSYLKAFVKAALSLLIYFALLPHSTTLILESNIQGIYLADREVGWLITLHFFERANPNSCWN